MHRTWAQDIPGQARRRGAGSAIWLAGLTVIAAPGIAGAAAPRTAAPAAAPVSFDAVYAEAQELYKAGKYAEALAAYGRAYAIEPLPEALYGAARCHHQMAHGPEAIAAYERFLAAAPAHSGAPKARAYLVEAFTGVAVKAATAGDHAAAKRSYEKALGLWAAADPEGKDATTGALLAGLGEAQANLGERAEAAATLEKALATKIPLAPRARAEDVLARLRDGRPLPGAAAAALSAGAGARPPPPKSSRTGLWIALAGGGAAIVAATIIVVVLLRPKAIRCEDLDCVGVFEVPLVGGLR